MKKKYYIVKALAPWMIDELIVISEHVPFELILLRDPSSFYNNSLKQLKENGVVIRIRPYSSKHCFSKFVFGIKFLFRNIMRFQFNYNGIIGLKSLWWFWRIDIDLFTKDCLIHAQFSTQPAVLALMIKEYFNNKPDFTFTFHAYDIYYDNSWFKILVQGCSKAFSISTFNIKYVSKKYVESDKIVLSRLGVFRKAYTVNRSNRQLEKQITVGLMSWFHEKKGIIYLLEAFKSLQESGVNHFKLKLAGDGPLKESLLSFIQEHKLSDLIDYVGLIEEDERKKFYTDIDIFVMPSIKLKNDQDGIPVVLMEAIATGLPLISTDVSGISEICIDDFNGFLIRQKSSSAIVKSLERLIDSKDNYNKFSKNSLKMSNEYDIEINTLSKLKSMQWK